MKKSDYAENGLCVGPGYRRTSDFTEWTEPAASALTFLSPPPQLQNQSELRAPTAEKAAFFLDAAIASRRSNQQDCDEDDHRNSHMLFTLHIYQYRMEKSGKGGSKSILAGASPGSGQPAPLT